jgi:hypothetical protein
MSDGPRDEHEGENPLAHPIHELEHLEEVAEEGKSAATPAILGGGLVAVLGLVVAILIAVAFLVAHFFG